MFFELRLDLFPLIFGHVLPFRRFFAADIGERSELWYFRTEMEERFGIQLAVPRGKRQDRFAVIAVVKRRKQILFRVPGLHVILERHFHGDLHGDASVFGKINAFESG